MKYTIVRGDDWQGLYVDGKLAAQGHRVTLDDLAAAAHIPLESKRADLDWLDSLGCLPANLEDVVEEE